MHVVEPVVRRVPIYGAVLGDGLAVDALHVVVVLSQRQHLHQLSLVGQKLGVGAVHELDASHLVECDGR